MTIFTDFTPSNVAPFTFSPEFDGTIYNVVVTWNLFGRRYYVSCYDLSGNRIFTIPLIGSPAGLGIQAASWASGIVTAATIDPHGYAPGSTIRMTISGTNPTTFDGTFDCLILDPMAFTYAIAENPGPLVSPGNASRNINMAAGYFDSSFVYRAPNNQFEVSP